MATTEEAHADEPRRIIIAENIQDDALRALCRVEGAAGLLGHCWSEVEKARALSLGRGPKAIHYPGRAEERKSILDAERAKAEAAGEDPHELGLSGSEYFGPWPEALAGLSDAAAKYREAISAAAAPVVDPAGAPVRAAAAIMGAEWTDRANKELGRLGRLLPSDERRIIGQPVPVRLQTLAFRPQHEAEADPLLALIDDLRFKVLDTKVLGSARARENCAMTNMDGVASQEVGDMINTGGPARSKDLPEIAGARRTLTAEPIPTSNSSRTEAGVRPATTAGSGSEVAVLAAQWREARRRAEQDLEDNQNVFDENLAALRKSMREGTAAHMPHDVPATMSERRKLAEHYLDTLELARLAFDAGWPDFEPAEELTVRLGLEALGVSIRVALLAMSQPMERAAVSVGIDPQPIALFAEAPFEVHLPAAIAAARAVLHKSDASGEGADATGAADQPLEQGAAEPLDAGLRFMDAASHVRSKLTSISPEAAKKRVSDAIKREDFKTNGLEREELRIDRETFMKWLRTLSSIQGGSRSRKAKKSLPAVLDRPRQHG